MQQTGSICELVWHKRVCNMWVEPIDRVRELLKPKMKNTKLR